MNEQKTNLSVKSPDDFTAIPDWLMYREDFTAIEKVCYGRMRRFCLREGHGWASQETLAKQLGCSVRKVRDCVKKFRERGMLKVVSRGLETNKFYVLIPPQFISDWKMFEKKLREDAFQATFSCPAERSELTWADTGRLADFSDQPAEFARQQEIPANEMSYTARKETSEEAREETEKRSKPSAGSLRSPEDVSLRSPVRTGSNLTKGQIPAFEITSPKWTDAAGAMVLPQPPTQAISPETFSEWNMTMDTTELRKRLEGLKASEEEAKAKNRAAVGVREQRRAAKEQKLKNLKGAVVTVGPGSSGSALRRLEALWMEEFTRKFPDALIAKKWEGKERGQMKGLIGLYSEEDVARAVRYYIRYWDNHRPRFFKGTAALPNVGQLRAAHAQIVPEAKQMSQALQVQAEYKKWSADNRMTALPPPRALQEAYDKVKSDLKTLGF